MKDPREELCEESLRKKHWEKLIEKKLEKKLKKLQRGKRIAELLLKLEHLIGRHLWRERFRYKGFSVYQCLICEKTVIAEDEPRNVGPILLLLSTLTCSSLLLPFYSALSMNILLVELIILGIFALFHLFLRDEINLCIDELIMARERE